MNKKNLISFLIIFCLTLSSCFNSLKWNDIGKVECEILSKKYIPNYEEIGVGYNNKIPERFLVKVYCKELNSTCNVDSERLYNEDNIGNTVTLQAYERADEKEYMICDEEDK